MRRGTATLLLTSVLIAALLLLPLTGCGPKSAESGDIVHTTKTGECYHRAGCRSLSRSDIPMTRAEAEAKGLRPCKVCKP